MPLAFVFGRSLVFSEGEKSSKYLRIPPVFLLPKKPNVIPNSNAINTTYFWDRLLAGLYPFLRREKGKKYGISTDFLSFWRRRTGVRRAKKERKSSERPYFLPFAAEKMDKVQLSRHTPTCGRENS